MLRRKCVFSSLQILLSDKELNFWGFQTTYSIKTSLGGEMCMPLEYKCVFARLECVAFFASNVFSRRALLDAML